MLKFVTIIFFLLVVTKIEGQDSSRLINYHIGFHFNYAGEKSPDFVLPFGFGIGTSATLDKFIRVKPTIELSAVGFPEYVIHLTNNSDPDDSKYAYGLFTLLAGAKFKLNRLAKICLTTGPSFNSREDALLLGVKPSLELNTKKDKVLLGLYYLNIINSKILKGYTGIAVSVKIR